MSHDATFQRGTTPRFYQRGTDRPVMPENRPDFETVDASTPSPAEVMAAFFAYVQSQLVALRRAARPADSRANALLAFLESQNLSPEEFGAIGLGLFTSVADVRTYLRSVGFSDAAIDEAGLLGRRSGDATPRLARIPRPPGSRPLRRDRRLAPR